MAQSHCVRKGPLLKCPQKIIFKQKWQSRWFVLYGNSEHGRVRIEYYDNEKASQAGKGKRVIPLSNCVSIKPVWHKDYQHVLEIVVQDKTIHLAASSKEEEMAWFKDLCKAVFGNASRNSIVQVVDKPSGTELDFGYHSLDRTSLEGNEESPRPLHTVHESEHESSNDITREELRNRSASTNALDDTSVDGMHGSTSTLDKTLTSSIASELSSLVSFESGFDDASSMASTVAEGSSYPVKVRPTLASQKMGMSGTYLLQINSLSITLIDIPTQNTVCEWPIQYLRRYGRGRTKFSFEASEKCKGGKGVYTFNTLEGDSIFHLVDMHARGISMRNQMFKRPFSGSETARPLGSIQRKHHSEGRLLDRFSESAPNTPRFSDSSNDILSIGPLDSISNMGTFPKTAKTDEPRRKELNLGENLQQRGNSIGSGISLEIAQNMSQSEEKPLDKLKDVFDSSYDDDEPPIEMLRKVDVSTIVEEETLADTLEPEEDGKKSSVIELHKIKPTLENTTTKTNSDESSSNSSKDSSTKKKSNVKRSSSLKLPNALRRSSSTKETKDASIKKSSSVKRSSSFRNRFFKSKSSDDNKKQVSKSEHDLREQTQEILETHDLDVQIAQHDKVKDYLARAIEDDMNRNSACELLANRDEASPSNASVVDDTNDNEHLERQSSSKRRKLPMRHKSNEMILNKTPEKNNKYRLSSSFAGYDYKGQIVLGKAHSFDQEREADDLRRLQRRTQSVMKKVELYETMKRDAEDSRVNSYTFWRRKTKDGSNKSQRQQQDES